MDNQDAPITFADIGITKTPQLADTRLGKVRLVLACILSPILIVLGVLIAKLYNDSGKLIFRTVGANTEQQAMCKTMFAFFGLLKFDLQLGVRWENRKLAIAFGISLLTQPGYILYKIIQTGENINDGNLALAATTFTCAALALIIRISVAIFAVRTYLNFGYGLSEKVFPMSKHRSVTDGSKDIQDSPTRHSEEGLKQDDS
ncbi:unnamed protein product [Mytilus edulis]|uniref:DUF7789 domain-containing protein n=1 Tax=Mytilus edulis TaxID=6550 RepID=A0A8S3T0V4_MYTED|nr:unnamed protein product [Mytilus edulis]